MSTQPLRDRYLRDGFVFPFDAMSAAEAFELRTEFETLERTHGADPNFLSAVNGGSDFILPNLHALTHRAEILDRVEEILGPNLIVFSTSLFIKEPHTAHYVSWHQDLTYWGMDGDEEVTAWVALSSATLNNGCMRMLPGSHERELAPHRDTFDKDNLLTRGQVIAETVDETQAVDVELHPGQFSLHHGRTFHGSHANQSNNRRIGVSINYVTPHMRNRDGIRPMVHLARGEDAEGNFQTVPPPKGVLHEHDIATLRQAKALAESFYYKGTEQRLATDAIACDR